MKAKDVITENADMQVERLFQKIENLLRGTNIEYSVEDLKSMLEPEEIYYDVMSFLSKAQLNIDPEKFEQLERLVHEIESLYSE